MGNTEEGHASVLTARENGELVGLLALVQKGKLKAGGDQWQRYLDLFAVQQSGDRTVLDTKPAPESCAPPDNFSLAAPAVPEGQSGAAEFYGVSVKTIKRWVAAGRAHKDPPPLQTPAEMPAWAARMRALKVEGFKHRCPAEIENAAAVVAAASQPPEPAAPSPARRYDDITPEEKNPRQLLARLEQEEARLHRRFLDALEEGEPEAELDRHRQRWTDTSNLLQLQRVRAEKSKDLLAPEDVDAAFERIVRPLPEALERSFPKEPPLAANWMETVRAAIRAAFARLPDTFEEMLA
jgi:hypothetical protein